jgi:hypothetical protein
VRRERIAALGTPAGGVLPSNSGPRCGLGVT